MIKWRHSPEQIHEIVQALKQPVSSSTHAFSKRKENGLSLQIPLRLDSAPLIRLHYHANGRQADVTGSRACLCVDDNRVRGVDYTEIERRRFYKTVIPDGWHENVIDYTESGDQKSNRHVPLDGFDPVDIQDFHLKCCARWNIEMEREEELWTKSNISR